ncbi:hypothetical protein J7E25_11700 [Agromyces sp. ISL-38]|uniref:hypothetical protein n=1 Tax=Agromyces sp. ISL-38 TaxID=2819107 RepID=UPI001BE7CA9A|nr:hypothetical protein [Agromyces sp. ISL-38]MBT2499761.1 hypothetical protein [Agromyces sp. ISL-38]MBT2516091.1 hypothetical protein [Streptomyces sp. ISL-90]
MTTPRDPDERYDRPEDRPADLPPELYTDSADAAARDPRTVPADRADVRDDIVDRQREQFGGLKIGSAFFGWLTATGLAVILTALLAATGAAIGLGVLEDPEAVAEDAAQNPETVGWVGGIALFVIVFVAYWCGGYVAGRMARFNGVRQGVAVWVWALVIAVVVAVLSFVAGTQFDILADIDAFPRIPMSEGEVTVAGIVTAVVVAIASLGGAILGGIAGTRYHRRVDFAGVVD